MQVFTFSSILPWYNIKLVALLVVGGCLGYTTISSDLCRVRLTLLIEFALFSAITLPASPYCLLLRFVTRPAMLVCAALARCL